MATKKPAPKPKETPVVQTPEPQPEKDLDYKEFVVRKDVNGLLKVSFTGIWHRAEIERASRLVLVKAVEHYRREMGLAMSKGVTEDVT